MGETVNDDLDFRGIVGEYDKIIKVVKDKTDDIINSKSPKIISQFVQETNQLYKKIEDSGKTFTLTKDCETLKVISETANAQTLQTRLNTQSMDFSSIKEKIIRNYPDSSGDGINFETFGDFVLRKSKTVPYMNSFLFGLGRVEIKERKRKVQQNTTSERNNVIEDRRNVQIKDLPTGKSNTLLVKAMDLLKNFDEGDDKQITDVITDESNFTNTVENAYKLSHLVRDSYVGIRQSDQNVVVYSVMKSHNTQKNDRRKQCVLHLRNMNFDDDGINADEIGSDFFSDRGDLSN